MGGFFRFNDRAGAMSAAARGQIRFEPAPAKRIAQTEIAQTELAQTEIAQTEIAWAEIAWTNGRAGADPADKGAFSCGDGTGSGATAR